jgi:hypothetical protein
MKFLSSLLALSLSACAIAAPLEERRKSQAIKYVDEPHYFTSAVHTRALRINSDKGVICWDITTVGVTGEYVSPAITATHLHQAAAGAAGPPRIAFPNPKYSSTNAAGAEVRTSKGCQKQPFVTGILGNNGTGPDTGSASGFTLRQIEENPSGFFGDTHTVAFPAGAIRGQFVPSERKVAKPSYFTSTLFTKATGDQVISTVTGAPVAGARNGKGYYSLSINTDKDILCYEVVLTGSDISTDYSSPAKTATHTHQAVAGKNGPPRLAFENPKKTHSKFGKALYKLSRGKIDRSSRRSQSCIVGPFTTGIIDPATGTDSGSASGFTLQALQDNPSGFFSDVHTTQFSQGAVRGQLSKA